MASSPLAADETSDLNGDPSTHKRTFTEAMAIHPATRHMTEMAGPPD
jgi:hypothetical protein